MNIAILGQFLGVGGPSESCRGLSIGLKKAGHKIRLYDVGSELLTKCWFTPETEQHLLEMATTDIDESKEHYVIHMYSPMSYERFYAPKAKKNVAFIWPEYQELPETWLAPLSHMTEIWTPSSFCANVIKNSGLKNKISVVPFGINHNIFNPDIPVLNLEGRRGFTFLHVGEWSGRKNSHNVFISFCNAFRDNEDVSLIMKVYDTKDSHDKRMQIMTEMRDLKHRMGNVKCKIYLVRHQLNESQMGELYRACDCFVMPSRGEGFGSSILEAMACGTRVITTNVTGQADFVNNQNSFLINNGGYRPMADYKVLSTHPWYSGLRWADPNVHHLVEVMRRVRHTEKDEDMINNGIETAKKFSWEISAAKAEKLLQSENNSAFAEDNKKEMDIEVI